MAKDKSKKPSKQDNKPITDDSRFSSVHSDPRFKLPNLNRFKVKVDERFSKKELEKLSIGSSGKKATIDRYGRKIKEKGSNLDKFYEHSSDEEEDDNEEEEEEEKEGEEEEEAEEEEEEEKDEENDDSEEESEESDSNDEGVSALDRARGEGAGIESESDSDDESEDLESADELEEESDIELEEGKPEEGDPSDTFAVVNMDWDNLRAVDLMATFISFVPKSGAIKSISIYPSEFGKEQMQKEETEGPSRELFKKKSKKAEEEDSDDDDIDTTNAADLERAAKKLYEEGDGEEDYDSKALRRYQLQRLRYYYAVVKCDSIATAQSIYKNCDGTEYESTANIFDLRYVPEGMEFDDSEAKDICNKIPANYKPNTLFVTDALQHSKVKLTWDETPKERLAMANRAFSQKEIDEMDFKAYLASGSEDEQEPEDDVKDKYKSLLGGVLFGSHNNKDNGDDDDDEDEVDMEITFDPGLTDQNGASKGDAKVNGDEEDQEDTLSAYKRKQKERRKARLDKFKQEKQSTKSVEDDTKQPKDKKKHKQHNKSEPMDEKSKAELELLLMDEDNEVEDGHFNMKDIIKAEKRKGKKTKGKQPEDVQDNFEVDLDDDRFKEIFENRDYNIDPTNTDFKKTKTMKKILNERSKRQAKSSHNHGPDAKKSKTAVPNELNSLVEKLKRKHHQ